MTRLLDLSGLQVCTRADRVGGGPNNPTGHWESKTVLAANNRLLESASTRWWCPPAPGAALAGLGGVEGSFRAAHPASPWVAKDPRFAFTLPTWRAALDDVTAAVVVLRRADEVVASLRRTWQLSVGHAAALWTRYLHAAARSTTGLPVAFVRFPEILTDVPGALASLAAGLKPLGFDLHEPASTDVDDFLRSPSGVNGGPPELPTYVWRLWDELTTVPPGFLVGVGIGEEDPSVEAELAPLRAELRAGRPIDTRPVFARAGDAIG